MGKQICNLPLARRFYALEHGALAPVFAHDEHLVEYCGGDAHNVRDLFHLMNQTLKCGNGGVVDAEQIDVAGGADDFCLDVLPETGRQRQGNDQRHYACRDTQHGDGRNHRDQSLLALGLQVP